MPKIIGLVTDTLEERQNTLSDLKWWSARAQDNDRQWQHVHLTPLIGRPPDDVLEGMIITEGPSDPVVDDDTFYGISARGKAAAKRAAVPKGGARKRKAEVAVGAAIAPKAAARPRRGVAKAAPASGPDAPAAAAVAIPPAAPSEREGAESNNSSSNSSSSTSTRRSPTASRSSSSSD